MNNMTSQIQVNGQVIIRGLIAYKLNMKSKIFVTNYVFKTFRQASELRKDPHVIHTRLTQLKYDNIDT